MKSNQLVGGVINSSVTVTVNTALVVANQSVVVNSGTAKTVTIPLGLPVGKTFTIINKGAGNVTIAGAVGITKNSLSGLFVVAQYGVAKIEVIAADEVIVSGNV